MYSVALPFLVAEQKNEWNPLLGGLGVLEHWENVIVGMCVYYTCIYIYVIIYVYMYSGM